MQGNEFTRATEHLRLARQLLRLLGQCRRLLPLCVRLLLRRSDSDATIKAVNRRLEAAGLQILHARAVHKLLMVVVT